MSHGAGPQSSSEAHERTACSRDLSQGQARLLEEAAASIVPSLFQELVASDGAGGQRPVLMEIACSPDSLLTKAVQEQTGRKDAASRCALWNSGDLSTPEGLKFILGRVRRERPQHIWLSPPCGPFSPMQHVNQRTEQQQQQLAQKRRDVMKVYVGVCCVVHAAVQAGIHCTIEMSERCDAWRLPLFQHLQRKLQMRVAVTQGCRVQLRDRKGERLLRKGWKLMTTHARLAEKMSLPCACDRKYQHGRCEGTSALDSAFYTPNFAQRVAAVLCQELSYQAVLQESEGQSTLPETFGLGEMCTCGESRIQGFQMTCSNCIWDKEELGFGPEAETAEGSHSEKTGPNSSPNQSPDRESSPETAAEASMYSNCQAEQVEEVANRLLQGKHFSHRDAEVLLQLVSQLKAPRPRNMLGRSPATYLTFGMYSHGNHYGVTNNTLKLPKTTQYLNQWIRNQLPEGSKWSSFVVSRDNRMPIHRDVHNDSQYPNHVLGLGEYTGGELWVEAPPDYTGQDALIQESIDGRRIVGRTWPTRGRVVTFDPKAWHGTCPWQGERLIVSAFVSRGCGVVDAEFRRRLSAQGFVCPKYPPPLNQEGFVLQRAGIWKRQLHQKPNQYDERIKKQLYLLHAATGHGSNKHLVEALRRRGAPTRVLELAKEFKCHVCSEKRRVGHRHLASLEPLPPRWKTISADVGHWTHPQTQTRVQFMLVIDECSRFRTARILTSGLKQQPSASACLGYLQEGWIQYFGRPKVLRLDPAGSFRSQAVEGFCDRHEIFLDIIPGEAHWKLGVCEQAIKGIKEVMDKMCTAEPELTPEEALAVAVMTFNQRDVVRGFSPVQHALGQNPDNVGPLLDAVNLSPVTQLWEDPHGEVERTHRLRALAEGSHASWVAQQRIVRAQNSKAQPVFDYQPGELVYFWRAQTGQQGRRQPGDKHGRFLGPARILATERKQDTDGLLRPGSAVWLVRGRSLLKCCVEQLRRASEREELVESLATPEDRTPWTFQRVASEIGGNQYRDYSEHPPSVGEWHRAQEPGEEAQPSRHRLRGKRPAPVEEMGEEDDQEGATPSSSSREPLFQRARGSGFQVAEAWWATVPEDHWDSSKAQYWDKQDAAVAVEIDLPAGQKNLQQSLHHFTSYFVGAMKRRAVEVSERRLTEEEKAQFRAAKAVEVRNFLAANAFETLPDDLRPSREQAIHMRWILTWKPTESGGKKAKARAVLLGYQDSLYEHRATTAPVMTRQTRQLQLQITANKGWALQKGDVSGAFLQGRTYPGELYCVPCKEICEAMGLAEGTITRLKRACYGLVDAPLEWYRTVAEYLQELGLERTNSDACAWGWRVQGQLRGMISGHVDDFLFSGSVEDKEWQAILSKIRARFQWGDWETDRFVQCGVQVERTTEGFALSQERYVEGIKEIPLSSTRRKDTQAPTTEREKTQLRALLGGLSWHAQQVAPHVSAEVSLLLSEVTESTVQTIINANVLAYNTKAQKGHRMLIHKFAEDEALSFYGWVDAASQNRRDGGSTQGILIGVGPSNMLHGELGRITPIAWHSNRIDRSCRSPGASEAQAAINGEDALYFARYQWSELCYGRPHVRHPDMAVSKVQGCLITDSRNVYDKLITEVLVIKGAEKRTNIELLSLKEAQNNHGLIMRWVHSEAQLANALTKGGSRELELFYRMKHTWRIVEDPEMMSARRRKQVGLDPLSSGLEKKKATRLPGNQEAGGHAG